MNANSHVIQTNIERLKLFSYVVLPNENKQKIIGLVKDYKDWKSLIFFAESHGMSSLLAYHLKQITVETPSAVIEGSIENADDAQTQEKTEPKSLLQQLNPDSARLLNTLVFRHKKATESRYAAMVEINDAFKAADIDFLLMKGVALAPLIYPDASMRPMGDIDLLVDRTHAKQTHQIMESLGYDMEASQTGFMKNHHHLPAASKTMDAMNISVEWHLSAIGRDYKKSLLMADAKLEALTSVNWHELTFQTFSLSTLLNQLCHNIAGVEYKIRLINIVDIYQLLVKHMDQLNDLDLKNNDFFVYNAIQCLHMHLPLPDCLHQYFDVDFVNQHPKEEVGSSMTPVSQIFRQHLSIQSKLSKLFFPSPWWLHMFYARAINKSLFFIRFVKHPLRLTSWFYQRIVHKNDD